MKNPTSHCIKFSCTRENSFPLTFIQKFRKYDYLLLNFKLNSKFQIRNDPAKS